MLDPRSAGYGYGIAIGNCYGETIYRHDGETYGFSSNLAILPNRNISIIILTNVSGSSDEMLGYLLPVIFGKNIKLPNERKNLPNDPAALKKVIGNYVFKDDSAIVTVINGQLVMRFDHGEILPPLLIQGAGSTSGTAM
jgi:hypothetical protein